MSKRRLEVQIWSSGQKGVVVVGGGGSRKYSKLSQGNGWAPLGECAEGGGWPRTKLGKTFLG